MIPMHGELDKILLPDIFGRIIAERRTGKLRMATGPAQTCIYFVDGIVVYATNAEDQQRLGPMLVREGLISQNDNALAMSLIMPGKRFGEILIRLGKIQSEDLAMAIAKQVFTICTSAFCMQAGQYRFNDGAKIPRDLHRLELSTPNIVMEGIRRMPIRDEMTSALGSSTQSPKLTTPSSQIARSLALRPTEARTLSRIDGATTTHEIMRSAPGLETETCKLLYGLHVLGLLEGITPQSSSTAKSSDTATRPQINDSKNDTEARPSREISDLDHLFSRINDLDYYDVIGVTDNASSGEIKRAYNQLSKQYHPDRIGATEGAEAQKKAERVFARITEAYQVLVDEDARCAYDLAAPDERKHFDGHTVRKRVTKVETEAVEKWAHGNFEKGTEFFAARMYSEAVQRLSQAVKANPRSVQYMIALAWAHSKNRASASEAEKIFARAINLEKFNPEPCIQMGKYFKERKEYDKAKALFQRALILDDHHKEALKEISDIAGLQTKKKSIWDKVTGH